MRLFVSVGIVLSGCLASVFAGGKGRVVTPFNTDWTFDGKPVTLPHTWNAVDGADGLPPGEQWQGKTLRGIVKNFIHTADGENCPVNSAVDHVVFSLIQKIPLFTDMLCDVFIMGEAAAADAYISALRARAFTQQGKLNI